MIDSKNFIFIYTIIIKRVVDYKDVNTLNCMMLLKTTNLKNYFACIYEKKLSYSKKHQNVVVLTIIFRLFYLCMLTATNYRLRAGTA